MLKSDKIYANNILFVSFIFAIPIVYILYARYNFMECSVPHDPVHIPIVAKHIHRTVSLLIINLEKRMSHQLGVDLRFCPIETNINTLMSVNKDWNKK